MTSSPRAGDGETTNVICSNCGFIPCTPKGHVGERCAWCDGGQYIARPALSKDTP